MKLAKKNTVLESSVILWVIAVGALFIVVVVVLFLHGQQQRLLRSTTIFFVGGICACHCRDNSNDFLMCQTRWTNFGQTCTKPWRYYYTTTKEQCYAFGGTGSCAGYIRPSNVYDTDGTHHDCNWKQLR